MKKKVVSALLCATMVATMFAGCGSKESDNNASTPDTSKADTSSEVSEPAEDTGKVLNIYCWNEEFKSRITAHYPDYNETVYLSIYPDDHDDSDTGYRTWIY